MGKLSVLPTRESTGALDSKLEVEFRFVECCHVPGGLWSHRSGRSGGSRLSASVRRAHSGGFLQPGVRVVHRRVSSVGFVLRNVTTGRFSLKQGPKGLQNRLGRGSREYSDRQANSEQEFRLAKCKKWISFPCFPNEPRAPVSGSLPG